MFALNAFKQSLKIAFAETFCTPALNDFIEQGWPVLYRLGKDLQEITIGIPIDEDVQFFQFIQIFLDMANTLRNIFVIRFRYV